MDNSPSLNAQHILLNLQANDRYAAFDEMISYLVSSGGLKQEQHAPLLQGLWEREELTTFAVGRNLAIPHLNGTAVQECTFLYARSLDGIEFGSCDSGLVHHLFLALIPEDKKCGWLKTLARVAKTLSDNDLRTNLMEGEDSAQIQALLSKHLSIIC